MTAATTSHARGMTLIEVVVALAVTAIVASFAVALIAAPPAALDAGNRRAVLRDNSVQALERIDREWRTALPNSLRARNAGGVLALEYLQVLDQATLFRDDPAVAAGLRLTTGVADDRFETLGTFSRVAKPFDSNAVYVAVHHSGTPGANAWQLANVISPAGTRVQIDAGLAAGQDSVQLTPPVRFNVVGAARRVYLIAGPVSYLCNAPAGTLARYSGYAIAANQALRDSHAELIAAGAQYILLATGVSACRYATTPSASAAQVVQLLNVGFRTGTDQIRLSARRVNDNAG